MPHYSFCRCGCFGFGCLGLISGFCGFIVSVWFVAVGGLWELWLGLVGYALLGAACCVVGFAGGCAGLVGVRVWLFATIWLVCLRVVALGYLVVGGCASAIGFLVCLAVCVYCGVGII